MSSHGPSGDVPHSELPGDQAARLREEGYLGSESEIEGSAARENLLLWVAVLGSAVVWFIQMQTGYAMVTWACAAGKTWPLHLVGVLFLILAAIPGFIGWKIWSAAAVTATERKSAGAGRRRFMALLGIMLTILFFLLIVAQIIPGFFVDPCLD